MQENLIFTVTEIKQLGRGFSRSFSVRLDGEFEGVGYSNPVEGGRERESRYTIHAVLPAQDFANLQIGHDFKLIRYVNPQTTPQGSKSGIVHDGPCIPVVS
jgi:hypothetical protein